MYKKPINKKVKIKRGRFKGEDFLLENSLQDMPGGDLGLQTLANQGNMAAFNALSIDHYDEVKDAPFYYGKIKGLGYIIAAKDLVL